MRKHPGLTQEPMLNGLPLREVQSREKRGQIIDYPGQRWLGSGRGELMGVTRQKDLMLSPTDMANPAKPAAAKQTLEAKLSPRHLEREAGTRPPVFGRPASGDGDRSLGSLWFRYRAAIDGWLAKTPWMSGASFNFLPLALIFGLGVFLPVKIFFLFLSLFLMPWPAVSDVVSGIGTGAGIGAIIYFAIRKLSTTTSS
jgi:hypothetical protein